MKKIAFAMAIVYCAFSCGCSLPMAVRENQLYSITREEKKIKGAFGKKKVVNIRDFHGNEVYEEDMAALKEKVEEYISLHAGIDEQKKNSLRELKVSEGLGREDVRLLLGRPVKAGKIGNNPYHAQELWVYRINKINAFNFFIIPVFFPHEGYYLYFKDNLLAAIERRYLRQTIQQGSAPGVGLGGEEKKSGQSSP